MTSHPDGTFEPVIPAVVAHAGRAHALVLARTLSEDMESNVTFGPDGLRLLSDTVWDLLPVVIWPEINEFWATRYIQCFTDIAAGLEAGTWNHPRCVGEAVAWKTTLEDLLDAVDPWEMLSGYLATFPIEGALYATFAYEVLDCLESTVVDPDIDELLFLSDGDECQAKYRTMGQVRAGVWFLPYMADLSSI